MDNIYKILKIVKRILEDEPQTRNSDDLLYVKVCKELNPLDINKPFSVVLLHLKDFCYPKFETVRRSRQKVQHDFPELSGTTEVEAQRLLNEEVFKAFSRSV